MSEKSPTITGFVIDGSNIASLNSDKHDKKTKPQDKLELLPLLLVVITLIKKGYDFAVYLDGNFRHGAKIKPYAQALNQLILQGQFKEAISTQADNYVIQLADGKHWGIISNDRYKDDKFTSYTWLHERESSRLVRASLMDDLLMLTGGLMENINVGKYTTESALDELFQLLGQDKSANPVSTPTPQPIKPITGVGEKVEEILADKPTDTDTGSGNTGDTIEAPEIPIWITDEEPPKEPSYAQKMFAKMKKELRDRNNGTYKEES